MGNTSRLVAISNWSSTAAARSALVSYSAAMTTAAASEAIIGFMA